jgi:hypothetical protein
MCPMSILSVIGSGNVDYILHYKALLKIKNPSLMKKVDILVENQAFGLHII